MITLTQDDYRQLNQLLDSCLELESRGFTIIRLRLPAKCMGKWIVGGGWTSCMGYFRKFPVEFTDVTVYQPKRLGIIHSS